MFFEKKKIIDVKNINEQDSDLNINKNFKLDFDNIWADSSIENAKSDNDFKDYSNNEVTNEVKEEDLSNNKEKISKNNKLNNKNLLNNLKTFFSKKFGRNNIDLLLLNLNDSIYLILLLILSIILIFYSFSIYSLKSKYKIFSDYYKTKNEVKIEIEKIKTNKENINLAEVLKFWVDYNWRKYPEWWYLKGFDDMFPDDISNLNILTFIEWWSSDFVDYDWKKIRIDNNIIKSFKKQENVVDNWLLKWFAFDLVLNGNPEKVRQFLYNLKYNNKIPKVFKSIKEKYNSDSKTLEESLEIIFYVSK